eukprot:TRINITY_DN11220_c0_g1_i1.p1 TRINITY_DN11220_c0_g1~~TRINITY_DN11220_c0_g1_i1.p1  ORF type:complete len:503 (+),score=73.86 TRINITY_DN11220_c0_g1_i1:65-1573(+)
MNSDGDLGAMEKNRNWIILVLFIAAITIRCMMLMMPHSGEGKPPMYGDYEAQRHWMEITNNLPVLDWYKNTADNDLQYWGLDYPPLTAFHSYICGAVGKLCVPEMVELHASRGIETYNTKVFMKLTVLLSDLFVYLPGAYYAVSGVAFSYKHTAVFVDALTLLWLHPCLLLIDHGHFQYNSVSIGLALFAVGAMARHRYLLASVFFTSSFLFKQIALYYAPAFFFGILALCMRDGFFVGVPNVLMTGLVVVGTVAVIFYPWLATLPATDDVGQVLHRMFPFSRGLFEDKVANFWCSVSVAVKFQRIFDLSVMLKVATGCTVVSLLPACLCNFRARYGSGTFVASVVASACSFFLFSFHVHEKSILFPIVMSALVPVAMPKENRQEAAKVVIILTFISLFSMYPLVVKDNLHVLYTSLMLATAAACELTCQSEAWLQLWRGIICVVVACHFIHAAFEPPERLPDLWTMMFTISSFCCFAAATIALTVAQLKCAFDLKYNPKWE